jgi:hypothetical protein
MSEPAGKPDASAEKGTEPSSRATRALDVDVREVTQASELVSHGSARDSDSAREPIENEEVSAAEESLATSPVKPGLAPLLWLDPDVRWLTGVHDSGGQAYLIRERYEELLWWIQMPRLLRIAAEPVPDRAELWEMSLAIDCAIAEAEAAGYRIDALIGKSESAGEPGRSAPEGGSKGETKKDLPDESDGKGKPEVQDKEGKPAAKA